ncbi:cytochrome c1 [Rhizobium mesoamericanum]|uniref:c-type cytochrome n=1 Tax=Rhizobium mesoamericanum TaxID=1079800 RepID=UPI00278454FA|nr:c-type cytochrome [Rhizobium mesoamericanum]MDQ0562510.1 cytochrome c1 [Rhizobium mesoamericanum]
MSSLSAFDRYGKLWLMAILVGSAAAFAAGVWIKDVRQRVEVARDLTGGDPSKASVTFRRYGCAGCHTIPGIAGADGKVAAPLSNFRQRVYIAGIVDNNADNLVHWIVSPQAVIPNTAMPATGVTQQEARDLAAYLYAH